MKSSYIVENQLCHIYNAQCYYIYPTVLSCWLYKYYIYAILYIPHTVSPNVSLTSSPSSPIIAGDTVTLTCSVPLLPGIIDTPEFKWKGPGGVTLTPTVTTTSGLVVSSVFTLSEIATSHAGQYTCTIRGTALRASENITVQSKMCV